MARVLVLEDMETRVDLLRKVYLITKIDWATSVDRFQDVYTNSTEPYDLLILDHDLGGPFYGSTDKNNQTGQHAVDFLLMQPALPPVLVWSVNPVAAPLMAKRLQNEGHDATWIPFIQLKGTPALTISKLLR
jgi:hypothetical protein